MKTSATNEKGFSRRGFVALATATAVSLLAAGCSATGGSDEDGAKDAGTAETVSDGSDESAEPADGASSDSSQAAAAPEKITFCLDYTPNTNHLGVYIAQAKGFFADEGLEVEIVAPPGEGPSQNC